MVTEGVAEEEGEAVEVATVPVEVVEETTRMTTRTTKMTTTMTKAKLDATVDAIEDMTTAGPGPQVVEAPLTDPIIPLPPPLKPALDSRAKAGQGPTETIRPIIQRARPGADDPLIPNPLLPRVILLRQPRIYFPPTRTRKRKPRSKYLFR